MRHICAYQISSMMTWAAAHGHEGVVKLLREYIQLNKYS